MTIKLHDCASVAADSVGDAGQNIARGGDGAAIAIARQIVGVIILRARLVFISGDVEVGIELIRKLRQGSAIPSGRRRM